MIVRIALTALIAATALAGTADAAPRTWSRLPSAMCKHDLFLESGIAAVHVRRVSCRRAIRALRRWVRQEMPRSGPRGWRCRRRTIGDVAPYTKFRCVRARARMRFTIAP